VYQCRLSAHLRGEAESAASPWELVSTKMFEREPEPPYDAALPLANDLAEALGIPWTLTDYA
jgi:hypothetical protein